MRFGKRYFKSEIYEYGVNSITLLHYSRTEFMVNFKLKRLLRKGIKDDDVFIPPEKIEIKVSEISKEEAEEIARKYDDIRKNDNK